MILEYKINEENVQPTWLETLYDLADEVNCKSKTYINEEYDKNFGRFARTRTIEITGSESMVNWIKLRMERYMHFVSVYNKEDEISTNLHSDLPF